MLIAGILLMPAGSGLGILAPSKSLNDTTGDSVGVGVNDSINLYLKKDLYPFIEVYA